MNLSLITQFCNRRSLFTQKTFTSQNSYFYQDIFKSRMLERNSKIFIAAMSTQMAPRIPSHHKPLYVGLSILTGISQMISECLFDFLNFPKTLKNLTNFCPRNQQSINTFLYFYDYMGYLIY